MRQQRERIAGEWNSVIRGASRIRGVDNLDGSYGQRLLISGGA